MQQDFLVFAGLGDAPFSDFDAFTRWQHYVHHAQFFKLLKNTTGFIAKVRFVAQAGQRFPEHVGQKTDQNVSQHGVFLLMPNRTPQQANIMILARERGEITLSFNPEGQGSGGVTAGSEDRETLEEILDLKPLPQPVPPFTVESFKGSSRTKLQFRNGKRIGHPTGWELGVGLCGWAEP